MTSSTAVLEARSLSAGYRLRRDTVTAVRNVDATIHAGEIVAVVGPNGAGKSTLLRTLLGLQVPVEGSVLLAGSDVTKMSSPQRAHYAAFVSTERSDPGLLTVDDVVALGRYPKTGWKAQLNGDDDRAIATAIERTNIGALRYRQFATLSDGERQRVTIARALSQEPRLLVLDEPTAFLDPRARAAVARLLRQLADDGLAVIVATHDLDLFVPRATTVWVVGAGTVTVGDPFDPDNHVLSDALFQELDARLVRSSARLSVETGVGT